MRVSYIYPPSYHYRYPFHAKLREILGARDIDYTVSYCAPYGENLAKRDNVDIGWGSKVPLIRFSAGAHLQWAPSEVWRSDLVILQQENRLLLNYPCQLLSLLGLRKVAFYGHGRNFQAPNSESRTERWKRYWATKVDWWFGYTDETRRYIANLGFPEDRITVFNNAVDTTKLATEAAAVGSDDLTRLRRDLGIQGCNVGIYVGGLYAEKRLAFLIEALDLIRRGVPDFEFIMVGGGPELPAMQAAAAVRPWLKVVGPKFGKDKTELMSLAHAFLIPGLVGLAILDAGIMGLPVITTNFPYHSPEIAYLEEGRNGIMVRPWQDVNAYAAAVIGLLSGPPERCAAMSTAAREIASHYTIAAMAERFAGGVVQALRTPPRRK